MLEFYSQNVYSHKSCDKNSTRKSLNYFEHFRCTDGHLPARWVYYKLTLWVFGSGELINFNFLDTIKFAIKTLLFHFILILEFCYTYFLFFSFIPFFSLIYVFLNSRHFGNRHNVTFWHRRHNGNRHFGTVDIMGIDILGIDILAPTPFFQIIFINSRYLLANYTTQNN